VPPGKLAGEGSGRPAPVGKMTGEKGEKIWGEKGKREKAKREKIKVMIKG
jgi:hypothetical protein